MSSKLWDSVAEEVRPSPQQRHECPDTLTASQIPHDQDNDDDEHNEEYATPGSIPSHPPGTSDGALLLGTYALTVPGQIPVDVKSLYPKREQLFGAWELYQSNVNPLLKLLHAPTFQVRLEEAAANPHAVSRKFDALVFAMCFIAINSASNEDCEGIFFAPKAEVLDTLQNMTSRALVAADILRSDDLEVLTAFSLFLVRDP